MDEWFVAADGAALYLDDHADPPGAPPGPTVVLLHCYALDLRAWDPLIAPLRAAGLRLLRYDHRGHGWSTRADEHTSVALLADDLAELLATGVTGPVVLVGHSLGGMVAMALADRHPDLVADRVAGVVFLATSSGDLGRLDLGLPVVLGAALLGLERRGVAVLTGCGFDHLPLPPAVLRPATRWLAFGAQADDVAVADVAELAASCHLGVMTTLRRSLAEIDFRLALIAFDGIPVVVAVGDRDRVTPTDHAREIVRRLPGAELVVLPGAGHMLPHERTDAVASIVVGVVHAARCRWDREVEAGWRTAA
jgi:pimeloyl-ACP methyl ester carboxylesterase